MYGPLPRPDWDYENFPDHQRVLVKQCKEVLIALRCGKLDAVQSCKDNRPQHQYLFKKLTPKGHNYFAGHYRGEDFVGLRTYEVSIASDPRVGVHSSLVIQSMRHYSQEIDTAMMVLLRGYKIPVAHISREDQLLYTVRYACKFFVEFLRVHPFANGNGHMARLLIFCFFANFGIWPRRWPMNDRPPDPPYSKLISDYRNGLFDGLEAFVLKCILGVR